MEAYWAWWLAAVLLIIAEMISGTFYLIAIAFGLSCAGLAAYLGSTWVLQAVIAALLCAASVAAIYYWKRSQDATTGQANLAYDIGQEVQISQWLDQRRVRVMYRGAEWDAELAASASADAARKTWRITDVVGSRLIIE
jgi:membrane protein implicated in regulation of membrane protease activity